MFEYTKIDKTIEYFNKTSLVSFLMSCGILRARRRWIRLEWKLLTDSISSSWTEEESRKLPYSLRHRRGKERKKEKRKGTIQRSTIFRSREFSARRRMRAWKCDCRLFSLASPVASVLLLLPVLLFLVQGGGGCCTLLEHCACVHEGA